MPKYEFEVAMTCGGCSGAVERVLKKKEGVSNFEISLEKQRVWVESDLPSDDILATISKTGKKTSYIGTA
ncbi:copper transport protein ATOX1-like [Rhopilema esculentum]|uniref:copper transport protein ATOX1-like n=1 Tax=Rhopilema esculentum TaxID=499914 RepID=UPI0031CF9E30|eukprot:gene901-10656_t